MKYLTEHLVSIIHTQDRLPCENRLFYGNIGSETKEHWFINSEKLIDTFDGPMWQTGLTKVKKVKIPTKEELAAIDAVKRAEESLKAAKKSLELIKENK